MIGAFVIGLYGYLFPGNINMCLMHLRAGGRYRLLATILLLALTFEFAYCYGALAACHWLSAQPYLLKAFTIAGCMVGCVLGLWMFFEKPGSERQKQQALVSRAVLSIVVHPQQIPYFIFVFFLLGSLTTMPPILWFAVVNTLGCAVTFCCYIWKGNAIIQYLKLNSALLQKAVGIIYVLSGIAGLCKVAWG